MSIAEPAKIITPWADTGSKNPIPQNSNNTTGEAGYDKGFPDITMTPPEAGGIPPAGQDFNGIFYEVTNILRYMQAGGQPTFDAALATSIGGYPKGAMVLGSDGVTLWQSKVDSNSTNPNTDSSDWGAFDIGLKEDLAAPSGSDIVGFQQAGLGAVPRTAQDKMREGYPSVADYGAVGDGTDDTAAFILAQNAHPFIEVPAGFTCKVNAGLQYWKFFGRGSVSEPGRTWSLTAQPQTAQQNKHYVETFGTYEGAAGQAISINSGLGQDKGNTPILGADSQGLAQVYSGRDHVGQIIYAKGFIPDVLDATTAYTLNTLGNVAVSGLYAAGKIKPGMIIDTQHTNPCTGIIKSVGGNTIEVDAWWPKVGASPITPANGVGAIINPNNKIFGQNVVVQTTGNGGTTGARNSVGIEINMITPASATPIQGTYGYDLSVLNGGYLDVGYQIYGKRNISFYSNNATGGGEYGFRSVGDRRGLSVEDAITTPIDVIQAGVSKFSVSPLGLISSAGGVDLSAVKFRSIGPNQVNTNLANVGTEPTNGSFTWITGYNISGGAEASFVLVVRDGVVDKILSSDGSGLGITFSVVRRQLKMKTTSGIYQFTGVQFLT